MQASFEPLGLTVAVAKDRAIESLMQVGDTFVLNCLGEGQYGPLMKVRRPDITCFKLFVVLKGRSGEDFQVGASVRVSRKGCLLRTRGMYPHSSMSAVHAAPLYSSVERRAWLTAMSMRMCKPVQQPAAQA